MGNQILSSEGIYNMSNPKALRRKHEQSFKFLTPSKGTNSTYDKQGYTGTVTSIVDPNAVDP
jgi:hypothetical protein